MWRKIIYFAFGLGIVGTILTWWALSGVDSENKIINPTDPPVLAIMFFKSAFGCGIDCIRAIQVICIILLTVGGLGFLFYKLKERNKN